MLNNKKIVFVISGVLLAILVFLLIIKADAELEETELFLAEVDRFISVQEMHCEEDTHKDLVFDYIGTGLNKHDLELIGRVVGFEESSNVSDPVKAMFYVASACYNRAINWYDGDVEWMICDNNGYYYQMDPDYLYLDECYGFNFIENYDYVMEIVYAAVSNPAPVYYWSVGDLHSDYATPYDIVGNDWFYSE